MRYTDHVRRSGCHKVVIETDTDGPIVMVPMMDPIQYNTASQHNALIDNM